MSNSTGSYSSVREYLERAFKAIEDRVLGIEETRNIKAVIVFGSAARPEDFMRGLSDIDVLVVTEGNPDRRQYSFRLWDSEVNITYMSVEEVVKIFSLGDPLAFILHGDRIILKDEEAISSLIAVRPTVTEHTLRVLRGSSFVALGLAIESYFHEDYKNSISNAYHAVRHLARYKTLEKDRKAGRFPISNKEVSEALDGKLLNLFTKLVEVRDKAIDKEECKKMLEETIFAIASELSLKHPSLSFLEENLKGEVNIVLVKELRGSMVIRAEIMTEEGIERLEVEETRVRKLKNLFECFHTL
ncbi:MAG: nucleotidyltransferase domain-containing protein [Candidatus Brockarchaeota archaeon]|nr:nucleotidyltransferase domain-containing protein [Candidatus Brockarchaeota archaeon]